MLMVVAVATGCLSDSSVDTPTNNPRAVRLWADIGYSPNLVPSTQSATRGNANSTSGIINAATDTVLTLGMARIDESHTISFPYFLDCGEPILAEMGKPNPSNSYIRDIKFTSSSQFFYNTTDEVKYVAWQPWKPGEAGYDYATSGSATTVKIPITGDSDILYGNVVTGTQMEGFDVMKFDHALCVYRIYIYSMQDEDGTQSTSWGVLEDMNIEDLPTSCTLTLPRDGTAKFGVEYEGSETLYLSDPDNNIYFNPGEKIPVGLANRYLVAKCVSAPPAAGVLNISLSTSRAAARQRVSIARNFKAGYAYDIVLRFSNHGFINADVSVSEWNRHEEVINQEVEVDMFYNLSTYETANTYIVNSGNYGYCIDATVKGNGDNSLVGGEAEIHPKYVDILWDDTPLITVDGVQRKALSLNLNEVSNGKILFNVQGNPDDVNDKRLLSEGNVVLAAYDEEGGNLLWTWHIWLTDRVSVQGYPSGYMVQDRNLGAVSRTPDGANGMDGLYYQWGRPTPFKPSASGIYDNITRADNVPSDSRRVASVEESMHYPTTLLGNGSAANDWLTTPNDALWGYQNEYTDLVKTMYDPCPPGYMVADIRVWNSIANYEKEWRNGVGVNLSVASNNVWYPFQGYIESDGTYDDSQRTMSRLWSSVVDLKSAKEPYELQYTAIRVAGISSGSSHRNRALPVRCVSSHSTPIVTDLSASQTANCYMIHRSGYYKFKARVRGNGVGRLLPLGGTTTAEINGGLSVDMAPSKVDVLWWQGDFTEVTGDRSDVDNLLSLQFLNNGEPDAEGYVTFYVGEFHKGNVGLAAYDVDGEILWSWHLWFTDKPADLITGNYTFMDRFIGATFAPNVSGSNVPFASSKERLATYGFYFQWGRKDPIMGPPAYNSGSESVSGNPRSSQYWVKNYMTGEWSSRTDIDTYEAATIPMVVQRPMAFYKSKALAGNNTSGWFPTSFADGYTNVALWGYAVKDFTIQGQTFSKTMHDPCPPGYRTPFHHAWSGYTYGENAGNITFTNGEGGFDTYGIVFNKVGQSPWFDRAWYPFVGYRYPTSGAYTNVGQSGWTLTGMPMGQFNCRTYVYTSSYAGQTASSDGSGIGPAYALPARCQKE